jgi:hypothetical protein
VDLLRCPIFSLLSERILRGRYLLRQRSHQRKSTRGSALGGR